MREKLNSDMAPVA